MLKRDRFSTLLLQLSILYVLLPPAAECLPVSSLRQESQFRSFVARQKGSSQSLWITGGTAAGGRLNSIDAILHGSHRESFPARSIHLLSSGNNGDINDVASSRVNRKNFLSVAISLLLSSSILLEVYSRIGAFFINDDDTKFLPSLTSSNAQHATIVFHGSGGQDQYTDALMERLQKENPSQYNQIVDWSKYSTNILQASFNGEQIGRLAAEELMGIFADTSNLKTIHLIGISVGSFAADAAARRLKQFLDDLKGRTSSPSSDRPFVQLTLLDPFTQRGIFGLGYGNRVFGASADYTQQFLNTDDPVPSTNAPLQKAVCYDITNIRPEEIFGHDWPVAYYGQSDQCGKVITQKGQKQATVGSIVVLHSG